MQASLGPTSAESPEAAPALRRAASTLRSGVPEASGTSLLISTSYACGVINATAWFKRYTPLPQIASTTTTSERDGSQY